MVYKPVSEKTPEEREADNAPRRSKEAVRQIQRSSKARAAGQRNTAFEAKPMDFLVSVMQGHAILNGDGQPILDEGGMPTYPTLKERVDVGKFMANKLVGNMAAVPQEDRQAIEMGDWVKKLGDKKEGEG